MTWHAVAKVGDLRDGDVIAVEVKGTKMVLGLDGSRYFATQRRCVHRGADLSEGIVSRGHVVCALHGWRFSIETGRHDTASDACLTVYAVRVTGDQIEIDPEPRKL